MLHEGSNLTIKLYKDKTQLHGSRGDTWGTEAEQKQVVTPKDMYKLVLKSGEPVTSTLSQWGEYNLTSSLIEREAEIERELTAQKMRVSMGDFKDKAENAHSFDKTVGKTEENLF